MASGLYRSACETITGRDRNVPRAVIVAYLNPGWSALTEAFIGGMAGH